MSPPDQDPPDQDPPDLDPLVPPDPDRPLKVMGVTALGEYRTWWDDLTYDTLWFMFRYPTRS